MRYWSRPLACKGLNIGENVKSTRYGLEAAQGRDETRRDCRGNVIWPLPSRRSRAIMSKSYGDAGMSETETTEPSRRCGPFAVVAGRAAQSSERARSNCVRPEPKSSHSLVSFDRRELRIIFDLYGAKVASGEWRDYAIDFSPAKAVFSIFRRACEAPLYRIEKNPELGRRQGAYCVVATTGLILRRGHDLARVVAVLQRKLELVRE